MKTIERRVQLPSIWSKIYAPYLENRSIAVFDIETTGLWFRSDQIILSGILLPDTSCMEPPITHWENSVISPSSAASTQPETVFGRAIQFFSDIPGDEAEIVRATIEILSNVDIIVTYNGKSFDIPFLKTRAAKFGIPCDLPGWSLDLFTMIQAYTDLKSAIGSLSQKNIERYMGLATSRTDEISGRESVDQFKRYRILTSAAAPYSGHSSASGATQTGTPAAPHFGHSSASGTAQQRTPVTSHSGHSSASGTAQLHGRTVSPQAEELERTILLHNYDDIMQLYRIMPILSRIDLSRALFNQGFPAGHFLVNSLHVGRDGLTIKATALPGHALVDYISFPTEDAPYSVMATSGTAEITIPADSVAPGVSVIDLVRLLGREAAASFPRFPGVESGYLILKRNGTPAYAEINTFAQMFLANKLAFMVE